MNSKKVNLLKTLRLDEELATRLAALVKKSRFSESDILRAALDCGFTEIESGRFNPLTGESTVQNTHYPLTEVTALRAAEKSKKSAP